jgi:hypothetical protein
MFLWKGEIKKDKIQTILRVEESFINEIINGLEPMVLGTSRESIGCFCNVLTKC